jgi:hypothetical protein
MSTTTKAKPKIKMATATPTICRPGEGPLNTDLLFALPRPRIGLPLPFGLALQASWIPPVPVAGAKANLFGIPSGRVSGDSTGSRPSSANRRSVERVHVRSHRQQQEPSQLKAPSWDGANSLQLTALPQCRPGMMEEPNGQAQ